MRAAWLTLLLFSFCLPAQARSNSRRFAVPLLPDREAEALLSLQEPGEALPRSRRPSNTRTLVRAERSERSPLLLGLELGTSGRANSTSSDALGLKLMWGGRVFGIFPATKRIYLKPSLGFFVRPEGVAKVAVTENMGEFGLNVQYALSRGKGITWLVGMVNRLEFAFSKTSLSSLTASATPATSSDSSPVLLRYRLGASLGMTLPLTPTLGMLVDSELTFSLTKPAKPYGGIVGGFIFRL